MTSEFPTCLFGFIGKHADIEHQTITGGETLAGGEDRIATDGGGRVFVEFSDGTAIDRNVVLAWRAVLTNLQDGVTPMVVPFCDPRHQPLVTGGGPGVTYADGATHSDGSPFAGTEGAFGTVIADAPLRATTISFTGTLPRALLGGEWFTVLHPTKGARAYRIRSINGTTGAISFLPPLREAVSEGETLDFENPRCIMTQDEKSGAALLYGRQTTPNIRFVEAR